MANDQDITPAILLQHMQKMHGEVLIRLDRVEQDLVIVKTDLGVVREDVRFLKGKANVLATGLENIDARLDAIELEFLPKRVAKLEEEAGIAA